MFIELWFVFWCTDTGFTRFSLMLLGSECLALKLKFEFNVKFCGRKKNLCIFLSD